MRIAKPDDAGAARNDQASFQDAAQTAQSDQPSSMLSSETSSCAPSPLSTTGSWQDSAGGSRQSAKAHSTYFGLTSASVLEDAPGNLYDHVSHPFGIPTIMDTELSCKGLEKEAAEQREHCCCRLSGGVA